MTDTKNPGSEIAAKSEPEHNESSSDQVASALHPGDQHDIPQFEEHASAATLKERIKKHYEIASEYYYSLWGSHIHHGYWPPGSEDVSKEVAQVKLIEKLLEISGLPRGSRVLDVGCGIGGTSRFLARERACSVTGITISGQQVQIARRLTASESSGQAAVTAGDETKNRQDAGGDGSTDSSTLHFFDGSVRFVELDAEKMLEYFAPAGPGGDGGEKFDAVWISEALSHFPNKPLFFRSAFALLKERTGDAPGRLVIADWFKAPGLSEQQEKDDIKPIEDGMLLPPLCTAGDYVAMAEQAGFRVKEGADPANISQSVAKTWDISWSLVSSPSLWAFAIAQGRDGLAFLQSFRAMRRGYKNGTFEYRVMCFEKP